jgi:alpha-L-fucosidase 2
MKRLPKSYCNLKFDRPITRWDEALPLGNGMIGALVWGESNAIRLSLDRGDLWDLRHSDILSEPDYTYADLTRYVREGNMERINQLFDATYQIPYPTKLPAGKLLLHFAAGQPVSSELNIRTATASLKIGTGDKAAQVTTFIHTLYDTGLILISNPPKEFSYELVPPQFAGAQEIDANSLQNLGYPPSTSHTEGALDWFEQPMIGGASYGIMVGSQRQASGNLMLAYRIFSSADGEDYLESAKREIRSCLEIGFEPCHFEHKLQWQKYWYRSSITLPDKLLEKNWFYTNYLLASASRKDAPPMPLQGVWTADDGCLPPWKGDYHNDLNTQFTYISYPKANHMAQGESFIRFLCGLQPQARQFAKQFYGTDGVCLPGVMAIDGSPLGGWGMYSMSPTNMIWVAQIIDRHAEYSGDPVFLRETAYPYLKEIGTCFEGLLQEDEEGFLVLPWSSSPEIHDNTLQAFVKPNSNYDLSLLRYLFGRLKTLSAQLEPESTAGYDAILQKLHPLAVNERNVLMVSREESLERSHRHFSHAMAIYPLQLLSYQDPEQKKIIDATVENLQSLGTGEWCGYTFGWMAAIYALQHNGNAAYHMLRIFWESFCSPNGFHLNFDYRNCGFTAAHTRVFTLEGNFAAADALQEMMLQQENGILRLFPAIPDEWRNKPIYFDGLSAKGGLTVSAYLNAGEIYYVSLEAKYAGRYQLYNPSPQITPKSALPCPMTIEGDVITVELQPDTLYTLRWKAPDIALS